MSILNNLQWRYATKRFAPEMKLTDSELLTIKESIRLAPTSFGLQPFKVYVVEEIALRKKLQAYAWNQPQIVEASHLMVFARKENVSIEDVREFIDNISNVREVDMAHLKGYQDMMNQWVTSMEDEAMKEWTSRQTYLALGTAITTCASIGVDACPMEGFDPVAFDEILELQDSGYSSKVILTLGFRDEKDQTQYDKKVRKGLDQLFEAR
ncbi:NAD(P)H-dependent oxidoreductase [Halosquirtibacter laminarini]|uniref:NAD(P)H-dependent oxidoreductase n=1 Tax=Halosquirtibacter laminarini TaxID=3374600 RepID=A0AC61NHM5_9BACT|nr:NAD(P)H-dependent oxidoreductase [Prolixibacteraceae bacterium]